MKKFLSFVLLVVFFFSSNPVSAGNITGGEQLFDVDFSGWFKNTSGKKVGIQINMPGFYNHPPRQIVEKIAYFPNPFIIEKYNVENPVFFFEEIKPGRTAVARILARLKTRRVIYRVDPGSVTNEIPKSVRHYLKSEPLFPAENELVKKTVDEVLNHETNIYYRALKLYDFVRSFDFQLNREATDTITALKRRQCQCLDAANVYITLCRAAGIPARFVGGIYLKESDFSTEDTHAWTEIYIHPYGWLPVDPTMARFNEVTRLSRFAEIDSPYAIMWRDEADPFSIRGKGDENQGLSGDYGKKVLFRAKSKRLPISVDDIYPGFRFDVDPGKSHAPASANPEVNRLISEGIKMLEQNRITETERNLRTAMDLDQDFMVPYLLLVEVTSRKKTMFMLRQEMEKNKEQGVRPAGSSLILGVIAIEEGNYGSAFKELNEAEKHGCNEYVLAYYRGKAYLQTKELEKALKYLNRALTLNPRSTKVYELLFLTFDYLEDDKSIIELCRAGLTVMNSPVFHYEMANSYLMLGEGNKALEPAGRALKAQGDNPDYLGLMGRANYEAGDREKGIIQMKKALAAGLSPPEKKKVEAILNRLK